MGVVVVIMSTMVLHTNSDVFHATEFLDDTEVRSVLLCASFLERGHNPYSVNRNYYFVASSARVFF